MFEPFPVLVLDTETGGLSPQEHSLLTVAGVAWTPNTQPQPLFSLYIKENPIRTEPSAMEVNGLDLNTIRQEGLSPVDAVQAIRYALDQHYGPSRAPICLAGHNVEFDKRFLKRLYHLANENYGDDFGGKPLDTVTIFQFFIASGLIRPGKANGDRMFASLGIPVAESQRHTALGDAWATALCLSRMAQCVQRGKLPEPTIA